MALLFILPQAELGALRNPSVLLTLAVGAIGFGGMFAVYSYLSAAMLATAHPPAWAVPVALSAFGVGGTLSNLFTPRVMERLGQFPTALVAMLFMTATQAFAALVVGQWQAMILSAFLLGLGSGMVVPLQTRLMDVAGDAQSMAAAMNHAAFNFANAVGPWLAGLALAAGWGWRAPGGVAVALSVTGIVVLMIAWAHARRVSAPHAQVGEDCAA